MKKLKALVIENESEVPSFVREFCKTGISNGLFKEVEYNCNSLNETPDDMLTQILCHNCIIVSSKWMYKDQLEQFVNLFANKLNSKPYTFFIWDIDKDFKKWQLIEFPGFTDQKKFLKDFIRVLKIHQVYPVTNGVIKERLIYEV